MPLQDRLRTLRKAKSLSRKRLNELSGVSMRTIQRLEDPTSESTTPHGTTVERLAKALQVTSGVLTGELPLPQPDNALAPEPRRVQIGAEIAPKARLAYDLIKRRYGVSATEIINVAPLFFTLFAELSLARRRENLLEASEVIDRLDQMKDEVGYWLFGTATTVALNAKSVERDSIDKADIFGENLLSSGVKGDIMDEPFDPGTSNPFADYLRWVVSEIDSRDVVDTKEDLHYGSPYAKFPGYDICGDELNKIAHGSIDARRALEFGLARLSEIPQKLLPESAGEQRAAWLEQKWPASLKDLRDGEKMSRIAEYIATATPEQLEELKDRNAARHALVREQRGINQKGGNQ